MGLRLASASDPGLEREDNEDSIFAAQDHGVLDALLVVADGMGGHASGQVASQIVAETVTRDMAHDGRLEPERLRQLLASANTAVYEAAKEHPENAGMGSTLTLAAIRGERMGFLNCGDSPAYLFRSGVVHVVYQDHSWPAEQVRAGIITAEEAENHPLKHRLARAVGVWDHVKGYATEMDLETGDVVLLCSDGVEEAGITIDEVHGLLEHDDLQASVDAIIKLARQRGAPDNISVVAARLE